MINGIMRDLLHNFVTIYLDDVYVYIRTLEEHLEHLRLMLQCFIKEGLKLCLKKMLLWSSKYGVLGLHCVC
jgi:hypothetical protein